MISYLIFKKQQNDIKVIADKFSWYAFFFSIFWALYHKMWKIAIIAVAVNLLISSLSRSDIIYTHTANILSFSISLCFGICANYFRQQQLLKQNYHCDDIIIAKNLDEAYLHYFSL